MSGRFPNKIPLACALALCSALAQGTELQSARELVEAKRFDDALAHYRLELAGRARDADLLIEAARVAGWGDRHEQAIDLYRRALDAAPQRRGDIVPPLALQLHWAGRYADAEPLLREAASLRPDDAEIHYGRAEVASRLGHYDQALALYAQRGGELRARLGTGRTLTWAGRYPEARAVFREVLAKDPNDREANWSLARATNLDDYPLAGASAYRRAAELLPGEPELQQERAYALYWSGLEEDALQHVTGDHPLARQIHRSIDPQTTLEYAFSNDSDDVWVDGWRGSYTQPVELGLGRDESFSASFRLAEVSDDRPAGDLDLAANRYGNGALLEPRDADAYLSPRGRGGYQRHTSVQELMFGYALRLGDERSPWGVWDPAISLGERRIGDWSQPAWKASLRWLPRDRWWLDLRAGNGTVETPIALMNEVETLATELSVTHRFDVNWLGAVSAGHTRYSGGHTDTVSQYHAPAPCPASPLIVDDQVVGIQCRWRELGRNSFDSNERSALGGWIERRVLRDPDIDIGVAYQRFRDTDDSSEQPERGYYSPEGYREAKLYANAEKQTAAGSFSLRLGVGELEEDPGEDSRFKSGEARWQLDVTGDHRLGAYVGFSDSRAASSGGGDGYWRNYGGVWWNWRL